MSLRRNADEILEALESAARRFRHALGQRQRDGASAIRDRRSAVQDRDSSLAGSTPTRSVPPSRATPGDGPVTFRTRSDMTPAEVLQMQRYVDAANRARVNGDLSPSGRVSTQGRLRAQASAAAAAERARAAAAGTPYQGVVGHSPDTTWTGNPVAPEWHDQTNLVNSSLGGQAGGYPLGHRPTIFRLELPDGSIYVTGD